MHSKGEVGGGLKVINNCNVTGAHATPVEPMLVIMSACNVNLIGQHTDEIMKIVRIMPSAVADLLTMPDACLKQARCTL